MTDTAPTISAVIILWNGRRFVKELMVTLEQNLAELPHEIIVVDNGSHATDRPTISNRIIRAPGLSATAKTSASPGP